MSEEVPNVKLEEVGKEMSIIDVRELYAECQVTAPEVQCQGSLKSWRILKMGKLKIDLKGWERVRKLFIGFVHLKGAFGVNTWKIYTYARFF